MRIAFLTRTVDSAEGLLQGLADCCDMDVFAAQGIGESLGASRSALPAGRLGEANDGRPLLFGDHCLHQLPPAFFSWRGPRVFYNCDPHFFWGDHVLVGRFANSILAGQKHMAERHRRVGHPRVEWLPFGFTPSLFYPVEGQEQTVDVLFIGSMEHAVHAERRAILDLLRPHFHVVAKRAPRETIPVENAGARIVLNIATRNDINFRVFETLGTRAFLLTNALEGSGLEEILAPGVHLATYRADNIVATVARYLRDDTARAAIAAAGHAEAMARHTWAHRAQRLVAVADELAAAGERAARPCLSVRARARVRRVALGNPGLEAAYLALPEPAKRLLCRIAGQGRSSRVNQEIAAVGRQAMNLEAASGGDRCNRGSAG